MTVTVSINRAIFLDEPKKQRASSVFPYENVPHVQFVFTGTFEPIRITKEIVLAHQENSNALKFWICETSFDSRKMGTKSAVTRQCTMRLNLY